MLLRVCVCEHCTHDRVQGKLSPDPVRHICLVDRTERKCAREHRDVMEGNMQKKASLEHWYFQFVREYKSLDGWKSHGPAIPKPNAILMWNNSQVPADCLQRAAHPIRPICALMIGSFQRWWFGQTALTFADHYRTAVKKKKKSVLIRQLKGRGVCNCVDWEYGVMLVLLW